MYELIPLTASAQTGNNTHAGVQINSYNAIAFQLVAEAVGATPTITWKIQASVDDLSVSDGNARWFDVGYITDASDTISTTTRTFGSPSAGQSQVSFLSNPVARKYRRWRVVTSANTNVTYRVEAYRIS